MKRLTILIAIAMLSLCGVTAYSQAGRVQQQTNGKTNQRPEASPTPSKPKVAPSDDKTVVDDGEIIKVNTQLVSIPVRVMDKNGRFIGGLKQENFKVLEDGQEQEIALFANENEPFTVALVLDMSMSATFKIAEIQNAAIAFIDQLRPQDRVMVVSFDEDVHVMCEPTADRKEIYRAIRTTKIATGTSLYEAVGLVMNEKLRKIDGRKAIILFTDGVDTTSKRAMYSNNVSDAMELDALIYPIRYDTFADVQRMKNGSVIKQPPIEVPTSGGVNPAAIILSSISRPDDKGTTEAEYQKAKEYLDEMAYRTGGHMYEATSLTNLASAYSKIASELREFYSVSYYPKEDRVVGKKTNIKVKVDQPGLVVHTREGYIVPKKIKIN
jgi:Ca-activated chloride channel family protein